MRACTALLLLFQCAAAGAREPPPWQSLELERSYLRITARASLSLEVDPDPGGTRWRFTARNAVAKNTENVVIEIDADSGRGSRMERLSRGRDRRMKQYLYGPDKMVRTRREPDGTTGRHPRDWPVTGREELSYPDCDGNFIGHAYQLILRGYEVLGERRERSYCVHTDRNFYRATLSAGKAERVAVDYRPDTGPWTRGRRLANAVLVRAEPVPGNPEKPDFALLGLGGDIAIFYDSESGMPLKVAGRAPRIGYTELKLVSANGRGPGR